MTPSEVLAAFPALMKLQDGWDCDGEAPAPNKGAIVRAYMFTMSLCLCWVFPESIEADAMGGVAVWVNGRWHGFMNDGRDFIVGESRSS